MDCAKKEDPTVGEAKLDFYKDLTISCIMHIFTLKFHLSLQDV